MSNLINKKIISKICARSYGNAKHFSTSVENADVDKKIEHYRNLKALETNAVSDEEWNQARPFDEIPGPKPLPIVGNSWRYLPIIGSFYGLDFLDIHKTLHKQYGDIAILKGIFSRNKVVFLFNPDDIGRLLRYEGVWPMRKGFPSVRKYRNQRTHILPRKGVLTLEGEEWFKYRRLINQVIMQPKNVIKHTDGINLVVDDLISNIRSLSRQNNQMPDDFEYLLYRFTLEAVGSIMMNVRFGCLNLDADKESKPQKMVHSVIEMFKIMYHLDVLPGLWKYMSTPGWRKFVGYLDFVVDSSLQYIEQRLKDLKNGKVDLTEQERCVLFQLVNKDLEVAKSWSVEMILAGVDTTAKVLGAAMYFLAKNPETQERLRREAFSLLKEKNTPVTKEIIAKATYNKATVKETTRLAPITVGHFRYTTTNVVLGGYQIPPGVHVQTSTLQLAQSDTQYPNAKQFMPERWLSTTTDEFSYKNANRYVFAPFGLGSRTCVGKRLAHLELEVALLKIIRNFELTWPHEQDMPFNAHTLHGIAAPLRVHVKEIS